MQIVQCSKKIAYESVHPQVSNKIRISTSWVWLHSKLCATAFFVLMLRGGIPAPFRWTPLLQLLWEHTRLCHKTYSFCISTYKTLITDYYSLLFLQMSFMQSHKDGHLPCDYQCRRGIPTLSSSSDVCFFLSHVLFLLIYHLVVKQVVLKW